MSTLRKKNWKQKKKFTWLGILVICLFFLFLLANKKGDYSKVEKYFKDFGYRLESFLIPKVSMNDQEMIEGINRELEEENQELSEMLELDSTEYHLIYATVIKRDVEWYQELTINKGEEDGIRLDMAVISNHGLIGKIVKTTDHFSIVKLLSTNQQDMKVAVDVKNSQETFHGIIDGYSLDEQVIQVHNLSKNSNIEVGNSVYTNGLGGIYPSGIYVGKVIEVTYDNLGLSKVVKVKPDISYEKLRYVSIVDRGN